MHCRHCRGLLSAYLDSELQDEEMWEVRSHLDHCSACQTELRSLRETKCALASLGARVSREEIERLLQTDVGEAARHIANMPVSPRTVAAAFLSLFGVWIASTRLATHDDRSGAPLPEGAYQVTVSGLTEAQCSSCTLIATPVRVVEVSPVRATLAPSFLNGPLPTPAPVSLRRVYYEAAPRRSTAVIFQTSILFPH